MPIFAILLLWFQASSALANDQSPRIESVVPSAKQPHEIDPAVIWYDDFNGSDRPYGEIEGALDPNESFGGQGKSLPCVYEKGKQGKGNRKVFFGDCPTGGNIVRKGETFDEIYWRVYVKHQRGWTGGSEAKLSRATSLASNRWTQAMIAHVWGGGQESLTLDPATGIRGDSVVTTRYNDFGNLHWLGSKPAAFPFSSSVESGWWVCVESYVKLNTPGQKDGVNRLWIDGRLESQRDHLDFRGSYTAHGINAVFLESYWNRGSPVTQTRWIDNFIISTHPIGPVVCPKNPTLLKRPDTGDRESARWLVELAADANGEEIVWKSREIIGADKVIVDATTGEFTGELKGLASLAGTRNYYCRVKYAGAGAPWSPWHQGFVTEK